MPGMAVLEVPGYDVVDAVEAAAHWWRARRAADGRTVLLRVLPTPESGDLDALRRTIARVGGLSAASLLPLHTVVTTGDGLVVVYDYPAGGPLTALLAARQRLSVGEVVTLGAGLADGLAQVHHAGLAHGDLGESSVFLGLDGAPLLADVGLAAGPPEADLRALAVLCRNALGGGRRIPLVPAVGLVAVLTATAKEPQPDAAAVATALRGAAPAVRIRLGTAMAAKDEPTAPPAVGPPAVGPPAVGPPAVGPPGDDEPAREPAVSAPAAVTPTLTRRRGPARTGLGRLAGLSRPPRSSVLAAAAATVALVSAVAVGVKWARLSTSPVGVTLPARPPPAAAPPAAAPPGSPPATKSGVGSWRAVLEHLDRRRAAAFAAGDSAALAAVDAPGSAALRADQRSAAQLRERGARPRGLRWEIQQVAVDSAGPPGVVLRVTDRMPAHDLISRDGAVLATRPARPQRTWRVTLLPGPAGWRISEIVGG